MSEDDIDDEEMRNEFIGARASLDQTRARLSEMLDGLEDHEVLGLLQNFVEAYMGRMSLAEIRNAPKDIIQLMLACSIQHLSERWVDSALEEDANET